MGISLWSYDLCSDGEAWKPRHGSLNFLGTTVAITTCKWSDIDFLGGDKKLKKKLSVDIFIVGKPINFLGLFLHLIAFFKVVNSILFCLKWPKYFISIQKTEQNKTNFILF
jgi:hypothetical protein